MKWWHLGTLSSILALGVAAAFLIPLPERLHAPASSVMEFRDGSTAFVFVSADDKWRAPVDLDAVDPAFIRALIRLEDKRFHMHPGVDPLAILRAVYLNISRGRRVSGGSTLTLQLVRMLEPRPRTFRSKAIEMLRALQLELRMSKKEILRAYLQFVPYGRNFEGLETGALAYFGHRADVLSPAEITALLAVPQDPNRRYPSAQNQKRLRSSRNDIAQKLAEQDALPRGKTHQISSEAMLQEIQNTEVPSALIPFPRRAPHLATELRKENPKRIRSTLDAGLQRLVEEHLLRAHPDAARRGIHNATVLLVDRHSSDVLAAAGNFDFWDSAHGGQIIGFHTPRSPGSTLKPLLYALAIEEGLAGPDMLVTDTPAQYGTYAPKNFDGQFDGLVRLETALSRSLNVPFVDLLQKVGVDRFLGRLEQLGVRSLRSKPGWYGLSAAVGGLELTPAELAGLYTTLAQRGQHRPLRWHADAPSGTALQVLSPGAAWLTRQALSLRDRPDFPSRRQHTQMPAHIHWKTGTSFGNRDAWAVGSNPGHTAVVWMGNFDNRSSSALVGADAAAPMLFDLLEAAADRARIPPVDTAPSELIPVEVCAYSGHRSSKACPTTTFTLARKTHVPTVTCPYHVQRDVDLKTGEALTPACRSGRPYQTRTFAVWPASVRRWLKDHHRPLPDPPPFARGCQPVSESDRVPSIVSPLPGQVALLLPGVAAEKQEISFEAEGGAAGSTLSWFLNGEFLGTLQSEERLWWTPKVGRHELVVADESGHSAKRTFEVRLRR